MVVKPLTRWSLFFSLTLALAACGGVTPPQASDQPTAERIEGQVAEWRGQGTLSVPGLPTATAPIEADGRFSLALPQGAAVAPRLSSAADIAAGLGCAGQVSSSDVGARAYALTTLNTLAPATGTRTQVRATAGSKTGLLSRQVTVRAWLYGDRATRLRGEVDCAAALGIPQIARLPVTVAVNVQPGWNVVRLTIDAHGGLGGVSADGSLVNAAPDPAPTTWRTAQQLQAQIGF